MSAPPLRSARAPLRPLRLVVDGVATYARVARVARTAAPGQAGATRTPHAVVCVHGFGVSGRYFVPLARRLGARGPVYVPDLPGHGRSGTPPAPLDVPGLAHALVRWMDVAGLRRVASWPTRWARRSRWRSRHATPHAWSG
jgi:pimeloyl-ACP methyl ester carboxylesterase